MGRSNCWALNNSLDQYVRWEQQDETNINVLHNLPIHPIRNQFWRIRLCTGYYFRQGDELDQLLLCLVRDLLHRLLKYLKARHVQDQFDNRLISVLWYRGLQHLFKPYVWTKTSPWQGVEIQDMIRTQAVHWALILNCFKDDRRPPAKTASIEMVLEEVRALCEWSLLDSQQDQTDLSLTAVVDTMNTFSKNKGAFRHQNMLKSAKTKVNKQLARNSWQLREQTIHKIHGAMEVLGHRAKKVTTS